MLRHTIALLVALAAGVLLTAPGAAAVDPMFTVSGVHVDARGYSASVAQSVAFAQGRPKAWQVLYRRLTRQQDWVKQPQLDDTALQRLVRNFTITNERRSTTRYTADISYKFNPAAVAKVIKEAKVAFTSSTAHRILLIPMNPGYVGGSAWSNAFVAPRFADATVPFTLPVGSALDPGALAHLNFDSAGWTDIADVALHVHATEAVLVLMQVDRNQHKLTLTLKRVGLGETPMQSSADVPYVQTALATYPAAADAAMSAIADLWKQRAAIDYGQQGKLTVDVRVSSLTQWASVQAGLASVRNVTSVTVGAMDIGEARITLGYLGTPEQLRDALSQASLQLSNTDPAANAGEWVLRQGPPSTPAQPAPGGKPPSPLLRPASTRP
jgi:hypothetical protein